jgi:hypothetical protein
VFKHTRVQLIPFSNPSPKSEFEIPSLFLSSIGYTADYITTSTTHPRVPLSDFVTEESTDVAVAFYIASLCIDKAATKVSAAENSRRVARD